MIALLRDNQRRLVLHDKHRIWQSFFPENLPSTRDIGFGFLLAFDELCLQPGASTKPHCEDDTEIVTYVYKGSLSHEDTLGTSGVIHTGEFQCMSTGRRIRHKETSVSQTDTAHLFRMSLRSAQTGIDRHLEQKRFTEAQRRNQMCVVASPDRSRGSLQIHQDAFVYSAILDPGHHIVYELEPGRTVWIHTVRGEVTLKDLVLTEGDGVGVTEERSVSLTVQKDTEILLVDLGPMNLRPWEVPLHGPKGD